ncbi:hypothetical protein [Mycetohabitans endofungorum]|uniref:hypothetical protein n=1 Tax=Mycetohabitans endofungorum TaxID=417203 RepID=UPI003BAEE460
MRPRPTRPVLAIYTCNRRSEARTGLGTEMLRVPATLTIERQCARFEWRVVRVTGEALHRLMGLQAPPDDSSI